MSKSNDNWMQTLWRPAMGWMYMLICLLDMAVFPVLWSLLQAMTHQQITQWNPLTLQGAGLFHIAMGAVLGIAAFGRTQEKLAGTAANPIVTNQPIVNNTNMNSVPSNIGMSRVGSAPLVNNTMSTPMSPASTITPPPVTPPLSSKSAVPTTSFPPL